MKNFFGILFSVLLAVFVSAPTYAGDVLVTVKPTDSMRVAQALGKESPKVCKGGYFQQTMPGPGSDQYQVYEGAFEMVPRLKDNGEMFFPVTSLYENNVKVFDVAQGDAEHSGFPFFGKKTETTWLQIWFDCSLANGQPYGGVNWWTSSLREDEAIEATLNPAPQSVTVPYDLKDGQRPENLRLSWQNSYGGWEWSSYDITRGGFLLQGINPVYVVTGYLTDTATGATLIVAVDALSKGTSIPQETVVAPGNAGEVVIIELAKIGYAQYAGVKLDGETEGCINIQGISDPYGDPASCQKGTVPVKVFLVRGVNLQPLSIYASLSSQESDVWISFQVFRWQAKGDMQSLGTTSPGQSSSLTVSGQSTIVVKVLGKTRAGFSIQMGFGGGKG